MSGPRYTAQTPGDEGVEAMRALVRRTETALEDFDDAGKMSFLTMLIREVASGVAARCRHSAVDLVLTLAQRVLGLVGPEGGTPS